MLRLFRDGKEVFATTNPQEMIEHYLLDYFYNPYRVRTVACDSKKEAKRYRKILEHFDSSSIDCTVR